jgi:S-formylglutathione hydrolase FrmB
MDPFTTPTSAATSHTSRLRLILALAVAALISCWVAPAALANEAKITNTEHVTDRLLTLTISTPAFTEPTKVDIDLPTGYAKHPSRHWPVTYFTAGTMNNYDAFNTIVDGQELTKHYPSIVVSPDANSGYWSDWYNAGAFGPPEYETFVIEQLIPLIDAHFRTIPNRAHRLIFGISMGGYGSMMLAARHPDLFSSAASLSGAVDSNLPANGAVLSASSTFDGAPVDAIYGPRSTQEVRWRGHNPTDLANNLRSLDLQVRTANGVPNPGIGEDPASADGVSCVVEGGVHGASIDLHKKLAGLAIGHLWQDYGPGCHTVPNFTREIVDTLATFKPLLADPPKRPARFDYRSIEPQFSVFNWTVAADPGRALEFLRVKDARRKGVTLIGSGSTKVTTPPFFQHADTVRVVSSAGTPTTVKPSRRGRLRFSVDLGLPHPGQQYTSAAQAAGAQADGYFTSVSVEFRPRGSDATRGLPARVPHGAPGSKANSAERGSRRR